MFFSYKHFQVKLHLKLNNNDILYRCLIVANI